MLEVIEIEKEQAGIAMSAPGSGKRLVQAIAKQQAIGETGEGIMKGLPGQQLLEGLALGYIVDRRDETRNTGSWRRLVRMRFAERQLPSLVRNRISVLPVDRAVNSNCPEISWNAALSSEVNQR